MGMTVLKVCTDRENFYLTFEPGKTTVKSGEVLGISRIEGATDGGSDAVLITITDLNGKVIHARTTMKLFLTAAGIFKNLQEEGDEDESVH